MSRNLKTIMIVLLVCILLLPFTACDDVYELYKGADKKVVNIELIYYDNPDARSNPKMKYPLDLDKLEILETLDTDNFEGFLNKLLDIWVHGAAGIKPRLFSHDGIGVAITYEDDSFTLITLTNINGIYCFFEGEYDKAGNPINNGREPGPGQSGLVRGFKSLINEFFDYR